MAEFDGPNTLITLNDPTAGVLNTSVQADLYSEWKRWARGYYDFATDTAIDGGTERITFDDHSLYTGQRIVYDDLGGSDAIGLTNGTEYFVRRVDRDTLELYDTKANAEGGPSTTGRIDLTAGTGETHRLIADNLKFLNSFRSTGGDPLTPGVESGAYFFLQNQSGYDWRIVSTDEDQTINYSGNLVAENSGLELINVTTGRSVLHLGLQPVTQRVDEILEQGQLAQYNGGVTIDVAGGVSGTAYPVGTPFTPVNNINDAKTIADNNMFRKYFLIGTIALHEAHTDWRFIGSASERAATVNINNVDVDNTKFENVILTGTVGGSATIEADNCGIALTSAVQGLFRECGIQTTTTMVTGGSLIMADCFSEVAGTGTPGIAINGGIGLQIRNYSGGIEITGATGTLTASIDLDPGGCTLASSCTGGTFLVRGTGTLTDNSTGTTIVNQLIDPAKQDLILAAVAGRAVVSVDDLTVTLYAEDGTTVLRVLDVSADARNRDPQ